MENMTVMSGTEAIVRGAIESGVRIMSGYPGYPITGIIENAKKAGLEALHIEWAPNEKVALETVLGTSVVGFRGMAVMKQVGLNVAADPLMSAVTWGVRGGVVIIAGDDPGCDGSPVEQDSRCYGYLANVPVLEPSTPEEGRQMVGAAFAASEKFGLPIILRFTKEYSVMRGAVVKGDISQNHQAGLGSVGVWAWGWTDPVKGHSLRHEKMEAIVTDLSRFNFKEMNGNLGIITSGYVSNLIDSALKQLDSKARVSALKVGVIPALDKTIEDFVAEVNEILVVEVGEPLIEQQVRRLSSKPVFGKMSGHLGYVGQIRVDDLIKVMEKYIDGLLSDRQVSVKPCFRETFLRPLFGDMKGEPVMCPGCPGIGLQYSLKKVKERCDLFAISDNGCVGFGGISPYSTLDYGMCMGGSTGAAHGVCIAGKKGVALIGDSAFMHSGIGGLINMVNNDSKATVIIFDNLSTAMTGRQPNPATGITNDGRKTKRIMIEDICRACGVEEVAVVDPYDLRECQKAIEKAVASEEISVLITRRECALLPGMNYGRAQVNPQKCTLCMDCVEEIKCPALSFKERIEIDEKCIGCMICAQVCPEGAIRL
ncbi:MAG: indolepyruvate ferredoxin oxidoreductase subunit alpha [Pseudomonadota bacterium]